MLGPNRDFTPAVLLSDARTGSTWLQSLLASHPNVQFLFEPFHPREVRLGLRGSTPLTLLRNLAPAAFAERLCKGRRPKAVKVAGFKFLFEGYRRFPEVLSYLNGLDDLFVIRLTRSPLPRLCSLELARRTGVWHGRGTHLSSGTFALRPREVEEWLTREEASEAFIREALPGKRGHSISYEALCADPGAELAQLVASLGLPQRELTSPHGKLESRAPRAILENFAELEAHFRPTRWSHHFSR